MIEGSSKFNFSAGGKRSAAGVLHRMHVKKKHIVWLAATCIDGGVNWIIKIEHTV